MKSLSLRCVQLFVTPWTVAYQAPLSMGFFRQQYWSGVPFPSAGIFPTQGSNPGLPHCRQILYRLSHQGSLKITNAGESVEKRESSHTVGGNVSWCSPWRLLKKLKTELLYHPATPFLGIAPGKTLIWKGTCAPIFIAAGIPTAKTQRQPRNLFIDRWTDDKDVEYVHTQ